MIMSFINDDFLLESETAKKLYYDYAEKMPIYDCHNHLSCKEIYENENFKNIGQAWLEFDHYKWRLMRMLGVDEKYITGDCSFHDKFIKFCEMMPKFIGNPVYHWSYLELKHYFSIDEQINKENAEKIYKECTNLLKKDEYKPQELLKKDNVKLLCTTDSPLDDLFYHKKMKETSCEIKILPSFRPDEFLKISDMNLVFSSIKKLEKISNKKINTYNDFIDALNSRVEYFKENGCIMSDHGLEKIVFNDKEDIDKVFKKIITNQDLTIEEKGCYQTNLLLDLAKVYYKNQMIMQLHIGPMRNVNKVLYSSLGKDVGNDSINDFCVAEYLNNLLSMMNIDDKMPKIILYCLNPKDNPILASIIGNFKDRVQFGPAWWFNDNLFGITNHLEMLASYGLITNFMGMLTDSRSILSMSRHEYFRRILCNFLGDKYEKGLINENFEYLGKVVEDICYKNIAKFMGVL